MKGVSHVRGSSDIPMIEETIGELFERIADQESSKNFVISHHQNKTLTYLEAKLMSKSFARNLLLLGFVKGDRLGIWMANCWEWVIIQIACAFAGVILVTVNPAFRAAEFGYAAKLVSLKGIVIQERLKSSNYVDLLREAGEIPSLKIRIAARGTAPEGYLCFYEMISLTEQNTPLAVQVKPFDACNIQFTSGTTGHPKGVVLSHRNIVNNAFFFGVHLKLQKHDVIVCPLPLYHCFGSVLGVLCVLSHGCSILLPSEQFNSSMCLESVKKFKGTILYGVPTMFLDIHTKFTQESRTHDVSTLRGGVMGGSSCPMQLLKSVSEDLNLAQLTCAYGMTETSPISLFCDIDESLDRRCTTVGKCFDHVEIKIVAVGTEDIVEIGSPGEILVKGYSVMMGYWNDDEKTKQTILSDGFLRTGDLATLDKEGFFKIIGRCKDIIIRGGENVYPVEVENFLLTCPGVLDASVVGVPDLRLGEEVCACVRIKEGAKLSAESILEFCKEKISRFKIPKIILFFEEFPLTATGKVKKQDLLDLVLQRQRGNLISKN